MYVPISLYNPADFENHTKVDNLGIAQALRWTLHLMAGRMQNSGSLVAPASHVHHRGRPFLLCTSIEANRDCFFPTVRKPRREFL